MAGKGLGEAAGSEVSGGGLRQGLQGARCEGGGPGGGGGGGGHFKDGAGAFKAQKGQSIDLRRPSDVGDVNTKRFPTHRG